MLIELWCGLIGFICLMRGLERWIDRHPKRCPACGADVPVDRLRAHRSLGCPS